MSFAPFVWRSEPPADIPFADSARCGGIRIKANPPENGYGMVLQEIELVER